MLFTSRMSTEGWIMPYEQDLYKIAGKYFIHYKYCDYHHVMKQISDEECWEFVKEVMKFEEFWKR